MLTSLAQDDEHKRDAVQRPRRKHGISIPALIPLVIRYPPTASQEEITNILIRVKDLCTAALQFADETLRGGGHFVTKFYQGPEDKVLESRLRSLFKAVYRVKPDASRKESNEAYFVALRRIEGASLAQVT